MHMFLARRALVQILGRPYLAELKAVSARPQVHAAHSNGTDSAPLGPALGSAGGGSRAHVAVLASSKTGSRGAKPRPP